MSEPLTIARFRALADAYGAAVTRWPEPVRAAATRMAEDPAARAILAEAAALDLALDLWQVAGAGQGLVDRIVHAAPARPAGMVRRAKLWWSAIGVAAALAGAAAGSFAAAAATADEPAETGTIFGDIGGQGS